MTSVNLSQGVFLTGWTPVLCLLAGAIAACLWLRPTSPVGHASVGSARSTQGVRLSQVNPDKTETETDIDIIAIHGLDTKSPETWTWRSNRKKTALIGWPTRICSQAK